MPLDQVSASYMAPGSVRGYFPVSATKQTTPIDGAFQNPTNTICRASPETQFSKASFSYSNIQDNFMGKNPRTRVTPQALNVTNERPSKRETPRFARSLKKSQNGHEFMIFHNFY